MVAVTQLGLQGLPCEVLGDPSSSEEPSLLWEKHLVGLAIYTQPASNLEKPFLLICLLLYWKCLMVPPTS